MKRIEERYISLLTDFGLKAYRDVKNSIDTALEKGREEGMEKEKLATARRLLSMGLSDEQVSTATELPLKEIQKMRE